MNESIEPNVANAEESFLEDIAETDDTQTIDTESIQPENSLVPKDKPVLIADGTIKPPPPKPEIISEIIV
ncbi:hypothetical protein FACHB389_01375 [Nostoc calcicola FACHB-389]|nr:hypothetical protein [Nostoc calcicola FACHB-3891]OKH42335.1 hypothetical protein FACHB389_01375 [Nostoc calcicola FACHB-389]